MATKKAKPAAKAKLKKPAAKKKAPAKKPAKKAATKTQSGQATQFKPGNELWRRSALSRRTYKTPEGLWGAACGYFEWASHNSLQEEKIFQFGGRIVRGHVSKLRAFTIMGFCQHAGIARGWFNTVVDGNPEFADVIEIIRDTIYEQKFTAAAAGQLDVAIIARELGLKDHVATEHSGQINYSNLTDDEIDARIRAHEQSREN